MTTATLSTTPVKNDYFIYESRNNLDVLAESITLKLAPAFNSKKEIRKFSPDGPRSWSLHVVVLQSTSFTAAQSIARRIIQIKTISVQCA